MYISFFLAIFIKFLANISTIRTIFKMQDKLENKNFNNNNLLIFSFICENQVLALFYLFNISKSKYNIKNYIQYN